MWLQRHLFSHKFNNVASHSQGSRPADGLFSFCLNFSSLEIRIHNWKTFLDDDDDGARKSFTFDFCASRFPSLGWFTLETWLIATLTRVHTKRHRNRPRVWNDAVTQTSSLQIFSDDSLREVRSWRAFSCCSLALLQLLRTKFSQSANFLFDEARE